MANTNKENIMSDWKPELYLQFEKQRTQPSKDLAARIDLTAPKRIIDIGCGPGNSTLVLKNRWPGAAITGLDSSPAMIAQAGEADSGITWVCADAAGDLSGLGRFDIVFSNAAIQWMPDHGTLLPKLFSLLESGGVLAVQVPNTATMPIHIVLQTLVKAEKWRAQLGSVTTHATFAAPYYYDILSTLTADFDLWETHYHHVMESHNALVQWYSSTGLRPYLNCLTSEQDKAAFLADFESALQAAYPAQNDGHVLFPFVRIFFIAKRY